VSGLLAHTYSTVSCTATDEEHDPPKAARAAKILRDYPSRQLVRSLVLKYGASPLPDEPPASVRARLLDEGDEVRPGSRKPPPPADAATGAAAEFSYGFAGTAPSKKAISVRVTNVGKAAGEAVLQLFVSFPDDAVEQGIAPPGLKFKGTRGLKLAPGEEAITEFKLTAKDRSVWDDEEGQWAELKGVFRWEAGPSQDDPFLRGTFTNDD
jgi:hypothetical protein